MKTSIYHDIALRTDSNIYIGVVGPVRTGKSTFVKKFMETLVIPNIENIYHKERAKDELPQSGSGKTIMTAEPKFVPEEAVPITLDGDVNLSVRMIDCVGYMINGASGRFENGEERMVSTPWFDYEVTMTQAAEMGTKKVISDHSTIGLVITTDGSVCGIDRSEYLDAENRVIKELQAIGKPFIILINSTSPEGDYAQSIKAELEEKYHVTSMCVNCLDLNEIQIAEILKKILMEFPIVHLGYDLPEWVTSLPRNNTLLDTILNTIYNISSDIKEIKHIYNSLSLLNDSPIISQAMISKLDTGTGTAFFNIELPKTLYYETLSTQSGFSIENDSQLLNLLTELKDVKTDYDRISDALKSVRETGYG
ncbi:MAG: stage IV sporulation protein A, partial [Lachnospiraceae bacterium]|nr:stage IV sporulation protein A [Lachnospiraceae bacterium]